MKKPQSSKSDLDREIGHVHDTLLGQDKHLLKVLNSVHEQGYSPDMKNQPTEWQGDSYIYPPKLSGGTKKKNKKQTVV